MQLTVEWETNVKHIITPTNVYVSAVMFPERKAHM